MFSMSVISALMLGFIFVFIVDISFNVRRVNKNMIKLLEKYDDVRGSITK